jgi:hypothetical protein
MRKSTQQSAVSTQPFPEIPKRQRGIHIATKMLGRAFFF